MYNFNQTSLSTPPMLGVGMDFCSGTPRTPEILNSLIAMTNPFEYSYASSLASQQSHAIPMSMSMSPTLLDSSPVIECKMENSYLQFDNNSQSNCSSSSSLESPSTTPFHLSSSMLSTTNTTSSTPSLQQVRTTRFLSVIWSGHDDFLYLDDKKGDKHTSLVTFHVFFVNFTFPRVLTLNNKINVFVNFNKSCPYQLIKTLLKLPVLLNMSLWPSKVVKN